MNASTPVRSVRFKVEKGLRLPTRGPRRRYTSFPLEVMEPNDSIKVDECVLSKRPSVYTSVKTSVDRLVKEKNLTGEYRVTTSTLSDNTCEVRIWRTR